MEVYNSIKSLMLISIKKSAFLIICCSICSTLSAQVLEPTVECTTGIIVIQGQVQASSTWCYWNYAPNSETPGIGDDGGGGMPSGSTEITEECYNHIQTLSDLPQICRHLDTGQPPDFDWSAHFLWDFKTMLCSVTPCTDPISGQGPFLSGFSDNLAYQLLSAVGTIYWNTFNAANMPQVGMPIIQSQCSTFPVSSVFGYDQDDCYEDALQVMAEISPSTYSSGLSWLHSINIHGVSINPNATQTNFGTNFLDKVLAFRQCALWQDERRSRCPNQ